MKLWKIILGIVVVLGIICTIVYFMLRSSKAKKSTIHSPLPRAPMYSPRAPMYSPRAPMYSPRAPMYSQGMAF